LNNVAKEVSESNWSAAESDLHAGISWTHVAAEAEELA